MTLMHSFADLSGRHSAARGMACEAQGGVVNKDGAPPGALVN